MKRVNGKRLLIVVNEDGFFLSHRLPVALGAQSAGWDVTVLAADTGHGAEIERHGLRYVRIPVKGTKMASTADIQCVRVLMREYRRYPDAVVHLVGLKMMLLGNIAARLTGKSRIVNAVSGLGILFVSIGFKSRMVLRVLRAVSGGRKGVSATIFQNRDDENLFRSYRVPLGDVYRTNGSGVDLRTIEEAPYPDGNIRRIIFTGRMLRSKGVLDLCQAAEMLRDRLAGRVRFILCGRVCENPDSLTEDELGRLTDGDYIEWLGYRRDVMEQLRSSSMIVFPSYYREGIPKSLIEAAAVGRAIITTDSVGCRETVDDGVNGYLVAIHAPEELSEKIMELINDEDKCRRMGRASRQLAEDKFNIADVVRVHLELYEKVYEDHTCNRET
ncbi:MAG: glycosyltransferase family 4 protein [Muribaculaceae bacterium]|nr:glycosyltransferase family 4 protein [Muribaculaceae bacterium]